MIRGVAGVWLTHLTWWSLKLSAKSWSLCTVLSQHQENPSLNRTACSWWPGHDILIAATAAGHF